MKISSRFSVAIHILSLLHLNKATGITSESLAASVNTNPVVIRRIIGQLKNAQLVANHRGSKGATLIRSLDEITDAHTPAIIANSTPPIGAFPEDL